MKKFIYISILLILFTIPVFATVIQSGVEIKHIPNNFYGNWRVTSQLVNTNQTGKFKEKSVDFWNISRVNDVIKLENPFSGASQTITVKNVNNTFIKFVKVGNYSGMKLTDIVTITLNKDTFIGVNEIKLDKISDIDGHVLRTDRATYNIRGEKLSGTSIGE